MLVVQILIAFALFTGLMYGADRLASQWTVEDPITLAERRRAHRAYRKDRDLRRRIASNHPGTVTPSGSRRPTAPEPFLVATRRPIQVVAADLRRLSRQVAVVPSGSTLVRWKALWAAYDGVLVEAAEMLELPQELASQPIGVARDVERVRVLAALEGAGLVVHG
jgi:hypothetical protein